MRSEMSEVEKMYKNAGVGYQTYIVNTNPPVKYPQIDFSAEKQLSLIKWLFEISDISNINIECENNKICIHNILGQSDDCDTIEDALASYINDIWQDLTESEQEQIRSILNG